MRRRRVGPGGRPRSPSLLERPPGQAEPAQVLAEPVGVVGAGAPPARDGEEGAPRLGQAPALDADAQHLGELHAIEAVELLGDRRGKEALQQLRAGESTR
jgi:hypothetical protein